MQFAPFVFGNHLKGWRLAVTTGAVLSWVVWVCWAAAHHVFWRDEVRALSIALQGSSVTEMLSGLKGEGHPAVWYLLLRLLHVFIPSASVLSVAAAAVALSSVIIFAYKSPFSWIVLVLLLAGAAVRQEYSVLARNYGISMLLMFLFAASYARYRARGVVLGVILAVLANCNAHSALLALAYCGFWLLDLLLARDTTPGRAFKNYALNLLIALIGVGLCAATIYPPFNDAAARAYRVDIPTILQAALLPAGPFNTFAGAQLWSAALAHLPSAFSANEIVQHGVMSLVIFGSILGLVQYPAAIVTAVLSLVAFSEFFSVIYGGSYRHQVLWLMFLLSLYWITGAPARNDGIGQTKQKIRNVGWVFFLLLLLLQVPLQMTRTVALLKGGAPESRSRDFSELVARNPELKDAIVIADPDYLLEPLPAYMDNEVYRMRERQFGSIVKFTKNARLEMDLDDVTAEAVRLHETHRRPVLILLTQRINPAEPAGRVREGYNWGFTTTPAQVNRFLSRARKIESFAPACCSDESFDVYLLSQ